MIYTYKLEEIDRTLFELIRLKLVKYGLLPDITQYTSLQDYKSAKDAIESSGKEVVEIRGVGTAEARDTKLSHEIIIDRKGASVGVLGGYPATQFVEDTENGTLSKQYLPDATNNIEYEIRVISNSIKYERILSQLIYQTLGIRKYHKVVENYNSFLDKEFFMTYNGDIDVTSTQTKERLFRYMVNDVWIGSDDIESLLIRDNIVPLTSVTFITSLIDLKGNEFEVMKKDIRIL